MTFSMRILLGLALLSAAGPASGDNYPPASGPVDRYPLSPDAQRAMGGAFIYPAGVNNPSQGNPPSPPVDMPGPMLSAPTVSGPSSGPTSPSNALPGNSYTPSWNTSPVIQTQTQTQIYPAAAVVTEAPAAPNASWYTRAEYYHWNERIAGADFVNEDGELTTLGYSRQFGIERIRAEVFGGTVHYDGYDQTNTSLISMSSNTGYLGLRGEYELVLSPAPGESRFQFLAGIGTRFWIRDLHDGSDSQGNPVYGYQETWWTMYPYLGLQTHLRIGDDWELYSESRAGATVLTYQFVSINSRPLWPEAGIFANMELGLRSSRFFAAVRGEVMSWSPSSVVQGSYQPNSTMFTVGARLGIMF